MKRVLFDTNVILDVLLRREPHFAFSARALDAVGTGQIDGYISAHAVTTIAYFLEKELGAKKGKKVLVDLMSKLHVAAVTDSVIRSAMNSHWNDFEDAVCHAAAQEAGVAVIVTRNVRDFSDSAVPAVLPDVFRVD